MYGSGVSVRGFTIVELLIVVVVVAILATITIVSYGGIQNRAKSAAVMSTVDQLYGKIAAYAVINSDAYPASLSVAGVSPLPSGTHKYYVDASLKNVCISSTTDALSYAKTNTQPSSVTGRCIMNYAFNPSAEGSTSLVVSGGSPTIEISTDSFSGWPISGARSFKITATTTGDTRPRTQNNTIPIEAGSSMHASLYIRNAAAAARGFAITYQGRTAGGSVAGTYPGPTVSIAPGGMQRIDLTLPADQLAIVLPGAAYAEVMISRVAGGAVGDVFYIDDILVTYGDTLMAYGDGTKQGWVWTTATNEGTSFGVSTP